VHRALLVVAIAACSGKGGAPPPKPAVPDAGAAAIDSVRVPDNARQLVTVVVEGWDATDATLALWTRDTDGGAWTRAKPPWPGTVGRSGVAWGRGLHGEGVPDGRGGPIKEEGDGKSPAGLFALGPAFGYAPAAPAGTRLPYTTVDAHWRCVDDAASAVYNRVLDERTVTPDWSSAEDMRRPDDLYEWVVEVKHNATAVPGGGSCIFLHVWGGPGDTTVGCTAMEGSQLATLIATLDPASNPTLVVLPKSEYAALSATWGLPPS
jgi:L,D-peptidoglycan transpeptidase YkuD (ErfK/YbiS/YcfS/YnhG family)